MKISVDSSRRCFTCVLAVCICAILSLATGPAAATTAYRASILHFIADPRLSGDSAAVYFADGLLVVDGEHVTQVGDFSDLYAKVPKGSEIIDRRGKVIVPGFIDAHVHYPQTEMVAAYGEQLLQWLNTYTFPTERRFADLAYARRVADLFLEQLLRNGTTSALVFATVHPTSVDALFEGALRRRMRLISGKVLMDRNAPEFLRDTPASAYLDSRALIERWHGRGRVAYAITPRFAPTSTDAELFAAGRLKREFPSVYVHTHLSENLDEIAWVKSLFPKQSGYLDVYDHFGLTGRRSIFAHSIHLTDAEVAVMVKSGSVAAFCPTSNLFLGSGLFPLEKYRSRGMNIALGTDIGAGTSFSILQTLGEAYKVAQLQKSKLSALEGFYLATLGGAKALSLDDKIGNFSPGKEADFVVLDLQATALLKIQVTQMGDPRDWQRRLFALMMLGDDRNVAETYVAGQRVYTR